MRKPLFLMSTLIVLLLGQLFLMSWRSKNPPKPMPSIKSYAQAPSSVLICGIEDHPCITYTITFHQPTNAYGDKEGEGVTDFETKTISIAQSNDRFDNVSAIQHEVFHAVLWERGFRYSEKWDIHAWIYFSDSAFPMLFHDNPELVHYIMSGY